MTLRYAHLSNAHLKEYINVLDEKRCKIVANEKNQIINISQTLQ